MPESIAQRLERVLIRIMEDETATVDQRLEAAGQLTQWKKIRPARKRAPKVRAAAGVLGTR